MRAEVFWILIVLVLIFAVSAWKAGFVETSLERVGSAVRAARQWLDAADGKWASLPERLNFRSFYGDFVETKDQWLWTGVEIIPIATDGYGAKEWNKLGAALNRVYTAADKTRIQIVHLIDNDLTESCKLLEVRAASSQSAIAPLLLAQSRFIKEQASHGLARRSKTYVFIGRKAERKEDRVPLWKSLRGESFIELEEREYREWAEDALRARREFIDCWKAAGGKARLIPARKTFELIYEDLNPARAKLHPAPDFRESFPKPLKSERISSSRADSTKIDDDAPWDSFHYDLFAENPRETLATSAFEIKGFYILIDGEPHATVSLQRLPSEQFPGLLERFSRNQEIDFPVKISTHAEIGSVWRWDEKLERKQRWARKRIRQGGHNPNETQVWKDEEFSAVRRQLQTGEEKILDFNLTISFSASTVEELKRRADKIITAARACKGMELSIERHNPLPIYLSAMACTPHSDFRTKTILSRDGVAFSPLTNGPRGLPPKHATEIFLRADGESFYWNYAYAGFNNPMSLLLGESGSGKSTLLNYQRLKLALEGRIGLTLDYNSSAPRVIQALGGKYFDITKTKGLGLFNIYPQKGERFSPDELNAIGLPKSRVAFVKFFLQLLSTDKSRETELPARLRTVLHKAVDVTYERLIDDPPVIDEFIRSCELLSCEEGEELAARLYVYSSNETLGNILNDRSEPLSVLQYVVFDFKNAKNNPDLQLVGTLAAMNYMQRFLEVSARVPKFLDFDELQAISDNPLICKAIDGAIRTARKRRCVVTVASQDPEDFTKNPDLRAIRSNCQIKWIFNLANLKLAQRELGLTDGQAGALERMIKSGGRSRDCMLIHPDGEKTVCVHLRIALDSLTARLCAGAGLQPITKEEALNALEAALGDKMRAHPNLLRAIEAEALIEERQPAYAVG